LLAVLRGTVLFTSIQARGNPQEVFDEGNVDGVDRVAVGKRLDNWHLRGALGTTEARMCFHCCPF
jgi:hypothetical protein